MTNFSVTKNGKKLDESLYVWDEETKTFRSSEPCLVLDFRCICGVTFNIGYGCTFNTGSGCTFNTGSCCTFKTGSDCMFNTGPGCTFNTGSCCTFKTGPKCTFNTGSCCMFNTGSCCMFNTGPGCTFNTGYDCVVVRRDVFEVIVLKEQENHIKLNSYSKSGYTHVEQKHKITIDREDIEISKDSFDSLKEYFKKL